MIKIKIKTIFNNKINSHNNNYNNKIKFLILMILL